MLGAIRGSTRAKSDIGDAGREAVADAIEGTASFDIDNSEAVAAAVEGAVEAVAEAGGDLGDAARVTVGGVVSGVSAAGGDVEAAARDATHALITHVASSEQGVGEIAGLAQSAVEAALEEADRNMQWGSNWPPRRPWAPSMPRTEWVRFMGTPFGHP